MIKNILFDMGGVIFRQNTVEAFRRFREAGIDADYYMGEYGQKDFFLDVETGKIDAEEFCRRMASVSGCESVSWEKAQYCWLGFIRDVPVERLHHLLELKEHYHLCLLSNTNPFIMNFTRSQRFSSDGKPISFYFDSLFCSYEMGAYKPNPDIFQQALDRDGMKAEETLFVDDSLKNIQAAEAVGIKGLHVKQNADWWEDLNVLLGKQSPKTLGI
ncbi:MAG: HAD family phosphatase [Bacteroides sp.]|nr:HAD family phosphatase [Bacteroides sp.]